MAWTCICQPYLKFERTPVLSLVGYWYVGRCTRWWAAGLVIVGAATALQSELVDSLRPGGLGGYGSH